MWLGHKGTTHFLSLVVLEFCIICYNKVTLQATDFEAQMYSDLFVVLGAWKLELVGNCIFLAQ